MQTGRHVQLVNLLGIVTDNIEKRKFSFIIRIGCIVLAHDLTFKTIREMMIANNVLKRIEKRN